MASLIAGLLYGLKNSLWHNPGISQEVAGDASGLDRSFFANWPARQVGAVGMRAFTAMQRYSAGFSPAATRATLPVSLAVSRFFPDVPRNRIDAPAASAAVGGGCEQAL